MLMKIIPIFIVVLSIGSFAQTDDPKQAKFIEDLNELRRKSANEYGISNMHELTYNQGLAQIAGSQDFQNKEYLFVQFKKYDGALDDTIENVKTFKLFSSEGRDRQVKSPVFRVLWTSLNPPQTKIGCAKNSNLIVCVFGDHKILSGWENSDKAPGSKCMDGYKNSDGLCVWELELEQKKFIAELNEERRSFAKEKKISNMHKLVFNKPLADTAKTVVWDEKKADLVGARVTWRYKLFKSYQNASHDSKKDMDLFNRVPEEEKLDVYKRFVNSYFPPFEQLVPLQRFAGCAVRGHVLCLFGPEKTFTMSDFSNSKAGCTTGYTLIDGLCTLGDPVARTPDVKGSQVTVPPVDPSADAPKNPEVKTEKPPKPTSSASSSPNQVDSPDKNHPTAEQNSPTLPTNSPAKNVPDPEQKSPKPLTYHIPTTTVESELDRKIAAYKANEQDGDVPSDEDEKDYESSNSGVFLDPLLISVAFVMISVLIA